MAPIQDTTSLEPRIIEFGKAIFLALAEEQPSTLTKNFWISRVMEWSMRKPEFKINLFRLVDVLPSLKSSGAIASHVQEYLAEVASELHPTLGWAMKNDPSSLKAKATAFAVKQGVQEIASLFIAGDSPQGALKSLKRLRKERLAFTIDLLGEFSLSEKEAEIYLNRYLEALAVLGEKLPNWSESAPIIEGHPGEESSICISVKLTALYSQCSPLNFSRSVEVLSARLSEITRAARKIGALLYVDAEDSANNPIIYETFKKVFGSPEFASFPYPGIVIQAYAKNASKTVDDMLAFAKKRGSPIAVRLVKGAYWDFETVISQQNDLPSPLFAHKVSSDAQFEALTRVLIDNARWCLPALASHNIRSLSHACIYAEAKGLSSKEYELQMLYGMAEPIARAFRKKGNLVRLYVPLGDMFVGMGYLVRRLLENTSNESFLRHTFFDSHEVEQLLMRPELDPRDKEGATSHV